MGFLTYNGVSMTMEDRTLAHLQFVVSTKLRRHEPFVVGWRQTLELGSGRRVLWIDNAVPLHFFYASSNGVRINPHWIEEMLTQSARAGGIELGAEPSASQI